MKFYSVGLLVRYAKICTNENFPLYGTLDRVETAANSPFYNFSGRLHHKLEELFGMRVENYLRS